MPRGSKPGERRGGRQPATPNKRTVLRERLLAIASANPTAATRELLLSLVNDPALPADTRLAMAGKVFQDDRPGSLAARSKQRPRDSKPAGQGMETSLPRTAATSVAHAGLPIRPTLDLLLRIAQDASARLKDRRKAVLEAARYFLPRSPGERNRGAANSHPMSADFQSTPIWRGSCGMRNCS
jgi:hypothetical protein